MQIVLPLLLGAAYGAVLHHTMRGRESRGAVLAPMIGAVSGALVWFVLTWAGVGVESPWIWLASLAGPALVTPLALALLRQRRAEADARERARLGIA